MQINVSGVIIMAFRIEGRRKLYLMTSLIIVIVHVLALTTSGARLWKILHMDSTELSLSGDNECDVTRPIRNDDMSEGDYYIVKSDAYGGKPHVTRRPTECTLAFNLGDRLVSASLNEWSCSKPFTEPVLEIYDDCDGRRKGLLLAKFNCTSNVSIPGGSAVVTVISSTYCITLYNYRGPINDGYYFSLRITALHELLSFPAGGIAAVIITSIVVSMILVKIVCVLSGYERRLPLHPVAEQEDPDTFDASLENDYGEESGQREQELDHDHNETVTLTSCYENSWCDGREDTQLEGGESESGRSTSGGSERAKERLLVSTDRVNLPNKEIRESKSYNRADVRPAISPVIVKKCPDTLSFKAPGTAVLLEYQRSPRSSFGRGATFHYPDEDEAN